MAAAFAIGRLFNFDPRGMIDHVLIRGDMVFDLGRQSVRLADKFGDLTLPHRAVSHREYFFALQNGERGRVADAEMRGRRGTGIHVDRDDAHRRTIFCIGAKLRLHQKTGRAVRRRKFNEKRRFACLQKRFGRIDFQIFHGHGTILRLLQTNQLHHTPIFQMWQAGIGKRRLEFAARL